MSEHTSPAGFISCVHSFSLFINEGGLVLVIRMMAPLAAELLAEVLRP